MLPFRQLKNFVEIVKEEGILGYHVSVYKKAQYYKNIYKLLFGENMQVFKMEEIMTSESELKRMVDFINISYSKEWSDKIRQTFDNERVNEAFKTRDIDKQIEKLLAIKPSPVA